MKRKLQGFLALIFIELILFIPEIMIINQY